VKRHALVFRKNDPHREVSDMEYYKKEKKGSREPHGARAKRCGKRFRFGVTDWPSPSVFLSDQDGHPDMYADSEN